MYISDRIFVDNTDKVFSHLVPAQDPPRTPRYLLIKDNCRQNNNNITDTDTEEHQIIAAQTTLASVQLQWPVSNSDINIYIYNTWRRHPQAHSLSFHNFKINIPL